MNIYSTVHDSSELRELFKRYSDDDRHITLQALQTLSSDYKFAVSQSQIKEFFSSTAPDLIDYVCFAQFIRHQETTLKRLFTFIDGRHPNFNDNVSVDVIHRDIAQFNERFNLHYFWSVDPKWVLAIFHDINNRRSLPSNHGVPFYEFRKEALLGSTGAVGRYYKLQSEITRHRSANTILGGIEDQTVWVPGIRNEDLREMFVSLSRGKGFIDIKTLHRIVKESKIPVSEHQIMHFFYQCDIFEDGKIDFFEFCHFMRSEEEAIRALFDQLDLDQTGYLTVDEIKRSFHIKYIKDRKETLDEELKNDMQRIDDWVSSVVGCIPMDDDSENEEEQREDGLSASSRSSAATQRRISYEDFRTYATLSGARSLLTMIKGHGHIRPHAINFVHDFDDILLPQRHDDDILSRLEDRNRTLDLITFFSGTVAGIVSRTATAPIDRVKLFMQLKSHGSVGSHVHHIMQERRGPLKIFAFWRGNLTNCIKMAPETAIKFTAHSMILRLLKESKEGKEESSSGQQYHLNFIAGAGAGATSQTLIYPLEIAKTRLALSQPGQYRNFIDCISSIYRFEGPRSLYNGWTASISGIIPYCAIEMGVFFTIKDRWHQRYGQKSEPDIPSLFAMGVTASVSGTMVSYPFQLVRTKLQTQGMPGNKHHYSGLWNCFSLTWKRFGLFGLYAGIVPNFMKSIPATCLSYVVVERTKTFLKGVANID